MDKSTYFEFKLIYVDKVKVYNVYTVPQKSMRTPEEYVLQKKKDQI